MNAENENSCQLEKLTHGQTISKHPRHKPNLIALSIEMLPLIWPKTRSAVCAFHCPTVQQSKFTPKRNLKMKEQQQIHRNMMKIPSGKDFVLRLSLFPSSSIVNTDADYVACAAAGSNTRASISFLATRRGDPYCVTACLFRPFHAKHRTLQH